MIISNVISGGGASFLESLENHWKIMVFRSWEGPPCVPHIRAVILVFGIILGVVWGSIYKDFWFFVRSSNNISSWRKVYSPGMIL